MVDGLSFELVKMMKSDFHDCLVGAFWKYAGDMKLPRRQMMNARAEFQRVKRDGQSRVGKCMIISTLEDESLPECKFAFVTSKKVGKAHDRNFARRRFRDLISRYGEQIVGNRYVVIIGRYRASSVNFAELEQEFLKISQKLRILQT